MRSIKLPSAPPITSETGSAVFQSPRGVRFSQIVSAIVTKIANTVKSQRCHPGLIGEKTERGAGIECECPVEKSWNHFIRGTYGSRWAITNALVIWSMAITRTAEAINQTSALLRDMASLAHQKNCLCSPGWPGRLETQRPQMSGFSGSTPTSGRWCQQRIHLSRFQSGASTTPTFDATNRQRLLSLKNPIASSEKNVVRQELDESSHPKRYEKEMQFFEGSSATQHRTDWQNGITVLLNKDRVTSASSDAPIATSLSQTSPATPPTAETNVCELIRKIGALCCRTLQCGQLVRTTFRISTDSLRAPGINGQISSTVKLKIGRNPSHHRFQNTIHRALRAAPPVTVFLHCIQTVFSHVEI